MVLGRRRGSSGVRFLGFFVFAVLFIGGDAFGCETNSTRDAADDTAKDAVETWVSVVHCCVSKLNRLQSKVVMLTGRKVECELAAEEG